MSGEPESCQYIRDNKNLFATNIQTKTFFAPSRGSFFKTFNYEL